MFFNGNIPVIEICRIINEELVRINRIAKPYSPQSRGRQGELINRLAHEVMNLDGVYKQCVNDNYVASIRRILRKGARVQARWKRIDPTNGLSKYAKIGAARTAKLNKIAEEELLSNKQLNSITGFGRF